MQVEIMEYLIPLTTNIASTKGIHEQQEKYFYTCLKGKDLWKKVNVATQT